MDNCIFLNFKSINLSTRCFRIKVTNNVVLQKKKKNDVNDVYLHIYYKFSYYLLLSHTIISVILVEKYCIYNDGVPLKRKLYK